MGTARKTEVTIEQMAQWLAHKIDDGFHQAVEATATVKELGAWLVCVFFSVRVRAAAANMRKSASARTLCCQLQ